MPQNEVRVEVDVKETEKHELLVRLAATAPDNWLVGELASSLHDRYGMTDQDICDELWSKFQKSYSRPTIVDARLTFGVFPRAELRDGWGFSHLLEASRAARVALGKGQTAEAIREWVGKVLADLEGDETVDEIHLRSRVQFARSKAGLPVTPRRMRVAEASDGGTLARVDGGTPGSDRSIPSDGTAVEAKAASGGVFPGWTRSLVDLQLEIQEVLYTAAPDVRRDLVSSIFEAVVEYLTADEIEELLTMGGARR